MADEVLPSFEQLKKLVIYDLTCVAGHDFVECNDCGGLEAKLVLKMPFQATVALGGWEGSGPKKKRSFKVLPGKSGIEAPEGFPTLTSPKSGFLKTYTISVHEGRVSVKVPRGFQVYNEEVLDIEIPDKNSYQTLIETIILLGKHNEEILKYLHRSKCFVLSRDYDIDSLVFITNPKDYVAKNPKWQENLMMIEEGEARDKAAIEDYEKHHSAKPLHLNP